MAKYSLRELPCTVCRNPKRLLQEVSKVFCNGALGSFTGYGWTPVRERPTSLTTHTITVGEPEQGLAITLTLTLGGTAYLLSIRYMTEQPLSREALDSINDAIRKAGSQVLNSDTTTSLEGGNRIYD